MTAVGINVDFAEKHGRELKAARDRLNLKPVSPEVREAARKQAVASGRMAPTTIAERINVEHRAAHAKAGEAIEHALRAGALLIEAKSTVKHGAWATWLEKHTEVHERMAQRYMLLAEHKPLIESKNDTVSDLTLRGALSLIPKKTSIATENVTSFSSEVRASQGRNNPALAAVSAAKAASKSDSPKGRSKMNTESLFAHYRAQSARVPRDRANSLPGMSVVRRTADGRFVSGEITKAGTVEFGRFQMRDGETNSLDWIAYAALDSGDAFLCYSRGDANAILSCLKRAAQDAAKVGA